MCLSTAGVDAQICEEDALQSQLQYLRRMSLDLRGRLPNYDELASVVANGSVDPAMIEAMVDSEDFVSQMRVHHRDLLWTNIANQRISGAQWDLSTTQRGGVGPMFVRTRARLYRGDVTPCLDEAARFDPQTNEILTTVDPSNPSIRREGWVELEPYWAPGTAVQVCAFDAQSTLRIPNPRGRGDVSCAQSIAAGCGCGENLQWCQTRVAGTAGLITESMNEQLLRSIDTIVREDRPYSDIVLTKDLDLNGPLSHWLRHQTQTGGATLPAGAQQNHPVPEIGFNEVSTWQTVQRADGHSGILTMPAFLLKFGSDRGRANRFYNAFLCQDFVSNDTIPPSTDPCHDQSDLTQRCGCKGCHVALEPAAAHWGRWAEAGLLPLNEDVFPRYSEICADPSRAGNAICQLFYFTSNDAADTSDEAFVGQLKAYVYADETRVNNIAAGPEGIAQQAVDSGAFARCTTKRMWQLFMARDPSPEEAETIDGLADQLVRNGFKLKPLIKTLIQRPEYVQSGRFKEVE